MWMVLLWASRTNTLMMAWGYPMLPQHSSLLISFSRYVCAIFKVLFRGKRWMFLISVVINAVMGCSKHLGLVFLPVQCSKAALQSKRSVRVLVLLWWWWVLHFTLGVSWVKEYLEERCLLSSLRGRGPAARAHRVVWNASRPELWGVLAGQQCGG